MNENIKYITTVINNLKCIIATIEDEEFTAGKKQAYKAILEKQVQFLDRYIEEVNIG